ncbi:MAG: outer membrane beta-barrel protein [Gammaproteobacteria bacterium]|nr:outer membrane beta-barrel protein [Gammaproteobacteria bacterium]
MKRKLSTFLLGLTLSSTAQAVFPGPYAGITLGEAFTNYSASNTGLASATVDNTGLGGSLYGGYQFNMNWGVELAYVQFPSTKFDNVVGGANSTGTVNENAIEIMIKGTVPISDAGFNITAKAGAAYLNATASHTFSNVSGAPNQGRLLPAYGVGFSYDVTSSTPLEISWSRIQNGGNMQSADLLGLSLTYFFN